MTIHYPHRGRMLCDQRVVLAQMSGDDLYSTDRDTVNCIACLQALKREELSARPKHLTAKRLDPAYEDHDHMPFGKHKGEKLSDVPASYLCWLWGQRPISDKKLENYIHNNRDALKQEHPDGIW